MMTPDTDRQAALLRRGLRLEWATIAWNAAEVFVTIGLGIAAQSLALIAFGLDSLIEIFASVVVVWHLRNTRDQPRTRNALRLIAVAFIALALFLVVASVHGLLVERRPDASPAGIGYLAATAIVMFVLAAVKGSTGRAAHNEPLEAEARMTFLDGLLAVGIFTALILNATLGWWWTDAVAGLLVAVAAVREGVENWKEEP